MPSIEGGGVEKNLFIISNFLGKKFKSSQLITASKSYNSKFRSLKVINPKINVENFKSRRLKYFFCILELIKIFLKNRNYLVFAFQANLYCILVCKFLSIKIVVRSNSAPEGWSKSVIKKYLYKKIIQQADKIMVNSYDFKKTLNKNP